MVRVRVRGRLSLGGAPAGRKEDDMPDAPAGVRAGVEIAIGVVRDARRAWLGLRLGLGLGLGLG